MARLPPLNALRAFDAASRHGSFTRAAKELHVTHGAVSRQVRQLEDFLGCALFRRVPRGLQLTAKGREFAFSIQNVFQQLDEAVTVALRTQQVIAHESGVTDFVDPFAGSYVVESLTTDLENKANEYIARIDELGGMVAAIELA